MRTYFFKNPWWLEHLYKKALFRLTDPQTIYLTFDDGPNEQVTPWVLDLLDQYQAKATFFLLGEQVHHHPDLVAQIIHKGHSIGGHTYNHLSGWKVSNNLYYRQVDAGFDELPEGIKLFRPPYGKIRRRQLSRLVGKGYEVVMWSHMAGDFDRSLNRNKSLKALCGAKGGSILVFHDTENAFENLTYLLPRVLDHFSNLRYSFNAITQ